MLMRPEHRKTKAKTETRKCETKTSLVNSVVYESKTNHYAYFINYYIVEIINNELSMMMTISY